MIIKIIINKLNYKYIAKFFNYYIKSKNFITYKYYIKNIKKYGFNYIIFIRNC